MRIGGILTKTVKELIAYKPIAEAAKLTKFDPNKNFEELSGGFVVGAQLEDDLIKLLALLQMPGGHGIWVLGSSGAGKTRTLNFLAGVASTPGAHTLLSNERLADAASRIEGKFETLLIDLAGKDRSMRDVVFSAMQQHLGKRGVSVNLDASHQERTDREILKQAMGAFSAKFHGKRYMLVLDGLMEFLDSKKGQSIKVNLSFLRDLSMTVKHEGLTLLLSTHSRLLTQRKFIPVMKHLSGKISCYNKVALTSSQMCEVLVRRCLQKDEQQQEYVRKHLLQFADYFPKMQENMDEYVRLFPVHPAIFEALEGCYDSSVSGVLTILSRQIALSLEENISANAPGLIAIDACWSPVWNEIAASADLLVKNLAAKNTELRKAVRNSTPNEEKCRDSLQIIDALTLRQVMLHSEEAEAGLTAQELRDQLCLWPEDVKPLHADELQEYVESLLSAILTISGPVMMGCEEETGRFRIIARKKASYSKKITLEEISQMINVSRTTLYKVINNKGHVAQNTRVLVEEALKKYHYIPNFNARDLAHHKTYKIGYIGMAHHGSTFFPKLVQAGIHKALAELADNGLEVVSLIARDSMPKQQIGDIEELLRQGIRDFIIVPCKPEVLEDTVKKMRSMNCNIIYLSRFVDEPHRAFVGIDYVKSGRLAAEMMSKILPTGGKIAITTSDRLSDDLWTQQRYDGFVEFLSGVKGFEIVCLREDITDDASAGRICQEILQQYPDLNGIYDISYKADLLARKMVQMHREHDVKLIGFDLYDAAIPYIKSSVIDVTIGQSLSNQAYDAVKMMFYRVCYGMPIIDGDYNSRLDVIVSSNVDCFDY